MAAITWDPIPRNRKGPCPLGEEVKEPGSDGQEDEETEESENRNCGVPPTARGGAGPVKGRIEAVPGSEAPSAEEVEGRNTPELERTMGTVPDYRADIIRISPDFRMIRIW